MKTLGRSILLVSFLLAAWVESARAASPVTITLGASNVTWNAATLSGSVNPRSASTKVWFQWGTTTNYDNITATQMLSSGNSAVLAQQSISNLAQLTTYHFRVVASNSSGLSNGLDAAFTTLGAPAVTTGNPTNITTNSVTLAGNANPNGLTTMAWFQWGLTTNYGLTTTTQAVGAGSSPVPVQANLSSLLTDTNYHYRLVASNAAGVTYGNDVIATPTLLLYLYAGESWTYEFHDLPFTSTSLGGSGFILSSFGILSNSFSSGGSLRFEMFGNSTNDNFPLAANVFNAPAGGGFLSAGGLDYWSDHQGTVRLTMLTGSVVLTSIYFQEVGPQSGGFSPFFQNTIVPTRYPQPPSFGTQFVRSVSFQSAVVSADIDAKNLTTGVFVQWGATTNYGFATGALSTNRDYSVRPSITVSNLAFETAYHLRVVATNSAGTNYGYDLALITLPPCTAVTLPANNRRPTSADLNAVVTANGFNTTAYFEWGATTNYGQSTPLQALGNPATPTNILASITGLTLQTTYHYRALAYAMGVTNRGADVTFSTTPAPTNLVVTNLLTDDVRGAIERGGTVVFACDGVLVLGNQIEIANDISLDATGHAITFSGSNVTRIFKVFPGTSVTLTNITFANGRSTNAGGAIYSDGTIVAQNCRFLSNAVIAASGAPGTNGNDGTSSAAYNPGAITPGQPGGSGGAGGNAAGGAILNSGSLTLSRCFFATNRALAGPGGAGGAGGWGGQTPIPRPMYGQPGGAGGGGGSGGTAQGGAIANWGILAINNCTFSNSLAFGGDGGSGAQGGSHGNQGFQAQGGAGGAAGIAEGGALFTIFPTVNSNSFFARNVCLGGQGGWGGSSSPGNWGIGATGGVARGGAIYIGNTGHIVNCTFFTNTVRGGGGGLGEDFGLPGGDAVGGAIANTGTLHAVHLTLSGNSAFNGASAKNGSLGGSIANTGGVFQIVNSILAGGFSNNCFGAITDLGHNISSDATPVWTSGTSLNNTDPLLLPLADNGGPTLTMALRVGSPALNSADPAASPATDQRGYPRPNGLGYDIGAYEGPGTPAILIVRKNSLTNVIRAVAEIGRTYHLEQTTIFDGWASVATNSAPQNGFIEFHVPANPSPRFFRVVAE